MREIRHLIEAGHIKENSELATDLLAMARNEDKELMNAFRASYEGAVFNKDSFNIKFFLQNAEAEISQNKK